jgi:thymidine kinase
MAKLYFRHGTVSSAKTLNLLAVAHNYRQQGKRIVLVKPALDTRFGDNVIKTRAGLEQDADAVLMVHREDYYRRDEQPTGIARIGIEQVAEARLAASNTPASVSPLPSALV